MTKRSSSGWPVLMRRALLLVCASTMVAGCTTLRVGSDFDRSASFGGYHAFTWLPRERHGSRNPLVTQRAHDAIQTELTGKGFVGAEAPETADFIVDFTIGSRDRTDIHSYPASFAGSVWWGSPGWWGSPYWGSEVDVRQYQEGTLSIDVFDAKTRRPVWHGWAKKELTRADLENSEAPIRTAVAAVLEKFPPK